MSTILLVIGSWLMLDGIISIIIYREQTWYEHLIRIIRFLCGLGLVMM